MVTFLPDFKVPGIPRISEFRLTSASVPVPPLTARGHLQRPALFFILRQNIKKKQQWEKKGMVLAHGRVILLCLLQSFILAATATLRLYSSPHPLSRSFMPTGCLCAPLLWLPKMGSRHWCAMKTTRKQ